MNVTDWCKIIDDIGGWVLAAIVVVGGLQAVTAIIVTKIAKG